MSVTLGTGAMSDKHVNALLQHQFDNLLLDIRESFHRWSRFSSRNDALEEICKFLLFQIKATKRNKKSLTSFAGNLINKEQADEFIIYFNTIIDESIPDSILATLSVEDFRLKLDADDFKLINEICQAFQKVEWVNINNVILLDLFNEAFGKFLIDSFSEEKQLGQYLTPIEVVRFIVQIAISNLSAERMSILIDPDDCKNFGYILDPSCGVGSFLIEVIHQLLPRVIEKHGHIEALRWLENMGAYVLVGLDKSTRMLKIAVTHFSAIGIDCKNLFSVNSLDKEKNTALLDEKLNKKASMILTNPPFGAEFRGKDIDKYKSHSLWPDRKPQKIDSEILFLERYVDWLSKYGNCLAVLPDSILTNKGIYQDIRNGISKEITINKVISLPQETFSAAGTTAKTSIIDFSLMHSERSNVYFAICKDIGFKVVTKGSHKKKIITNNNDLIRISSDIESKENKVGVTVFFDYINKRWDAYFNSLSLDKNKLITKNSMDYVNLTDIAMLVNNRIDPRRSQGSFRYIEISDVDSVSCIASSKIVNCSDAPSRARKLVKHGDILASTVRPEQKKFGVVINILDNNSVCTTGFAVIRPLKIESFLLASLLKTDFVTEQLLKYNIGVAYPVVDESCFGDLLLPISMNKIIDLNKNARDIFEMEMELKSKKNILEELLHA